ncbi:MAG: acetyl-CoA carboxylase, carboxyltransferase subunit beta [Endomicrobiales bacterium]|nr:acetyl-CoA carboxylase, carboxyltransferase subunit beta [Endomicrobiales bacterium]
MKRTFSQTTKTEIPAGLWTKCKKCEQIIFQKELDENLKVCPKCGAYFRLTPQERIDLLCDKKSFKELDSDLKPSDPLKFPNYAKKAQSAQGSEAIVYGQGTIGTHKVVLAVMNFDFMGGSMGSVVGEKIARAAEVCIKKKIPLIIVSASGGARMQEGIISLMQMAKTSAALATLSEKKLPYISILTDPTTGGVTASFAMLGDIIIAEPKALICFAGPRVIEQTIRQKLPDGFQLSEFLMEHGMVDIIAERKNLKATLVSILEFFEK